MFRCRYAWQFAQIAASKLALSLTICLRTIITGTVAIRPNVNDDLDLETFRSKLIWLGFIYEIGLVLGVAGIASLVHLGWEDDRMKFVTFRWRVDWSSTTFVCPVYNEDVL